MASSLQATKTFWTRLSGNTWPITPSNKKASFTSYIPEARNQKDTLRPDWLIQAENEAGPYMTPEELERYADAELHIQEAEQEVGSLMARAQARFLPEPQETDPVIEAMLFELPPGLRGIVRRMEPDDLRAWGECLVHICRAKGILGSILSAVSKRVEGEGTR